MFQSKIDNEQISSLPRISFEGEIVVIDSYDAQNTVWEHLSKCDIVGFDTESRASFCKGKQNSISLLQLSGAGKVFLIRLNKTPLNPAVLKVLQSKSIQKIGVAVKDDLSQLRSLATFYPNSFIDLQKCAKQWSIEDISLKKLTAIVLEGNLSKAQRLSNWNAKQLTEAQLRYAATDAWVCEMIYKKLLLSDTEKDKSP